MAFFSVEHTRVVLVSIAGKPARELVSEAPAFCGQASRRRRAAPPRPRPAGSENGVPLRGVHRLTDAPAAACPIAIVEGAVDTLALRRRGAPCVALGIPGVSSWRAAWGAFARGRVAFVGLDVDQAGERACAIIARNLTAGGAVRVERLSPDHGKDCADALEAA